MSEDFRLLPSDEFAHTPDAAINYNESIYTNAFDRKTGVGGWMRVGNRVNEGYAEKSVVLYLPDGRIACAFGRPSISTNAVFDADGLKVDIVEPFRHLRHSYAGEIMVLSDRNLLRDPSTLFEKADRVQADIVWDHRSSWPLHGGEPTRDDVRTMYGRDFSRGHFNQHSVVTGHVAIGDERWEVDGFGWRDHSWGPRYWQNLFIHRLFMATWPSGKGASLLKIFSPDGIGRSEGALLIDGEYHDVMDLSVVTDWDDNKEPTRIGLAVRTATRSERIDIEIITAAPLRNRRKDGDVTLMSRIVEANARYRWGGEECWGMVEYIERVDDGRLVGWPI